MLYVQQGPSIGGCFDRIRMKTALFTFLTMLLWTAVIARKQNGFTHYQLSGVARFDTFMDRDFNIPRDRDTVAADVPQLDESVSKRFSDEKIYVYAATFWNSNNQDHDPHGYPIHAHCWTLIQRIIGPCVDDRLDLFIKVLRERWRELSIQLSDYIYTDGGQCLAFIDDGKLLEHDKLDAKTFALRDPIHIPAIRDLIQKSTKRPVRARTKRKTRSWYSHPLIIEPLESSLSSFDLPLDIKYIILDLLNHADIRNALVALGWRIPDQYWRRRFPKDIIWEIEELTAPSTDVVWEYLCLEAELLLESLHGLMNRQRIIQVLRGTKSLFFAAVGRDSKLKK